MADDRDFRIKQDLTVPARVAIDNPDKVQELRDILGWFFEQAVVINEDQLNEERGFIDLERCGHRLEQSCERIERWEVGRGKVYPKE